MMPNVVPKNALTLTGACFGAIARTGKLIGALAKVSLAACTFDLACASGLPDAPLGPHPLRGGAQPVAVDSAPPPARVEQIPPQPRDDCVWSDGSWQWTGNRWQWQPGAWFYVVPSCYYADPSIVWVPTVDGKGVLFYTTGQWYGEDGRVCATLEPCRASAE